MEEVKKILEVNNGLLLDIKRLLMKKRKRGKLFSYKKINIDY